MAPASYPFDAEFRAAIDDFSWHGLIVSKVACLPDELIALGYTIEKVQQYQDILQAMSFEDLLFLALEDGKKISPAALILQNREDRETFENASALCRDAEAEKRALGALILMRRPGEIFKEEARKEIEDLAKGEKESIVLEALAYALHHLEIEHRSQYLQKAAKDARAETRNAVAYSLGGCEDELAAQMLIQLSSDADDDTRDWATFGLHNSDSEIYRTEAVREALFARLHDSHIDTQLEAVEGLSKLKDERALPVLIEFLKEDPPYIVMVEAAEHMGHPSLLPYLTNLSDKSERVEQAIAACSI